MTAAVTFYDVVKWLHITAVVAGFGGTFAYGVIIAAAMKRHPRSMPGVLHGITENSRTLVSGGGVLVLLTGIYLAADADQLSEFYVSWGFVAIFVLLGMTHTVFRQNEVKAMKAAERDIAASPPDGDVQFSEEYQSAGAKLAKFGGLAGVIIVLTIYVMTAKPFL